MAAEVPAGMLAHIDRVVRGAERMARRHDLDASRTRLMAQAHDLLRAVPPAELLRRWEQRGLPLAALERAAPVLLHGPLGALELSERFGLSDPEILDAVRWHTTGHPDYSPEAWAFFIADKVEPEKVRHWSALRRVRRAAAQSLEEAALLYLDLRLAQAARKGWTVHPMANETRNALILRGVRAPGRSRP